MIARTAARFGLNYLYGLANFTAGVVLGAFVAGFIAGLFQ
jgi:hypothetical protein